MFIRRFFYSFMIAAFVGCFALTEAQGQETADELVEDAAPKKKKGKKGKKNSRKQPKESAEEKSPDKPSASVVADCLSKFKVINAKPNLKADYYIYFFTSSTCVHCVQCMPIAVEQYKKMKASRKVELLVVCADNTEDEAKNYLKKTKLKAPCIMFKDLQATKFQGLPSVGMPIPPSVAIVSKEGKMLKNGVGGGQAQETLKAWRDFTIGGK